MLVCLPVQNRWLIFKSLKTKYIISSEMKRLWHAEWPSACLYQVRWLYSRLSSMTRHRKKNGFSLIELLIVVAVILIIASIAIPNLLRSKMLANDASAVSVLRNTHNSQGVYVLQFSTI